MGNGQVAVGDIEQHIKVNGWYFFPAHRSTDGLRFLRHLGPMLPAGRSGETYRDLRPYGRREAPPHSMSSVTGTDAQPMHTDNAYFAKPPHYIAFQCLNSGEGRCPTIIWPLDLLRLLSDRPGILTRSDWVVRGSGHSQFYCSPLESWIGGTRIRFDPLCMYSPSGGGRALQDAQSALLAYSKPYEIVWCTNDILVIDNWRCLHARRRRQSGTFAASKAMADRRRLWIGHLIFFTGRHASTQSERTLSLSIPPCSAFG